jgi:hypothetical protein
MVVGFILNNHVLIQPISFLGRATNFYLGLVSSLVYLQF